MAEFQASQDSVVTLLTYMEAQISNLKRLDSEVDDEEQVQEKE